MTREDANFVRWVRSPAGALAAAAFYPAKVARRKLRQLRGAPAFYPPVIRSAIAAAVRECESASDARVDFAALPADRPGRGALVLTPGQLDYDGEPEWGRVFDEPETSLSLHRWNWLVRRPGPAEGPMDRAEGERLVRSWLRWSAHAAPGLWDTPYTRGERVANLGLFQRATTGRWEVADPVLRGAVRLMCRALLSDLEYSWAHETGNHAMNNGRALVLGGVALGAAALVRAGQAVVDERLGCLFDDGMLREESSHYQFLVTRWLLELADACPDWSPLQIVVPRAVRACRFFWVRGTDGRADLPLFGDVSPDCPPAWLADLPFSRLATLHAPEPRVGPSALATGWTRLWQQTVVQPEAPDEFERSGCRAAPGGDWHRLNGGGWTVFLKAERFKGPAVSSHGHADRGQVTAFWNGAPVLADSGRSTYAAGVRGDFGLGGRAHNVILLDGLPLSLGQRRKRYPTGYWRFEAKVREAGAGETLALQHRDDGFRRVRRTARLTRTVSVTGAKLIIEDRIQHARGASLTALYNWDEAWTITPGAGWSFDGRDAAGRRFRATIDAPAADASLRHVRGGEDPLLGWRCREFGTLSPAWVTLAQLTATADTIVRLTVEASN